MQGGNLGCREGAGMEGGHWDEGGPPRCKEENWDAGRLLGCREKNWDAGRTLGCREENWDAGKKNGMQGGFWSAGRTLGCRRTTRMKGGHRAAGQKMGLQGAVATLPLLQGRGGSCFIQEPSKAATGSVLGATSASDTATPRPSEPDPDPAPPSPLCHFGRLWFQAHGEVAAKALNRCQGWRAGRRHTLRTLPTPRSCPTRVFFLTPAPARQVGELLAPPGPSSSLEPPDLAPGRALGSSRSAPQPQRDSPASWQVGRNEGQQPGHGVGVLVRTPSPRSASTEHPGHGHPRRLGGHRFSPPWLISAGKETPKADLQPQATWAGSSTGPN